MNPDVQKLNEERKLAVESGKDPYAGNLANISTFRNTPISSANLGQTPITLPETTTPTAENAIIAYTDAQVANNTLAEEQKTKLAESQTKLAETETQGKSLMQRFLGVPQERAKLEATAEITAKDQALQDANKALAQSQRAQRVEEQRVKESSLSEPEKQTNLRQIARNYAFEQADLSLSANFALNNYEAGVRDVDRKMKLITEPLEIEYKFYSDFLDNNREDLSKAEQNLLETRKEERQNQIAQQTAIGEIQKTALANGINIPTSVLSQLNKAKTANEAYSILASNGISLENPLERQLKQANLYTESLQQQKLLKEISGTTPDQKTIDSKLQASNDIETLLANDQFNEIWGVQGYFKTLIPGSAAQLAKAQAQQVIDSLALAARGQLKGQGAVSDFEGKILKSAQTALNFNLSPEQAKKELIKVKGAIRTSSGLTATVKLTNPKTKETALVEVTQDGINKAITDGLQVEYQ